MGRFNPTVWLVVITTIGPSGHGALLPGGLLQDSNTSIAYDPDSGELAVDVPPNRRLSSLAISSASDVFIPENVTEQANLDFIRQDQLFRFSPDGFPSLRFGSIAPAGLTEDFVLGDLSVQGNLVGSETALERVDLIYGPILDFPEEPMRPPVFTPGILQPGDADQDQDFDQFDIVNVLIQGDHYQRGTPVTWSQGDWAGTSGGLGGGSPGDPPTNDGVFDQFDLIAALIAGVYLSGPYGNQVEDLGSSTPIRCCGELEDDQTSLVYDSATGELAVDVPVGHELNSINIDSVNGIFMGQLSEPFPGAFDFQTAHTIFRGDFAKSFPSISFGNVAQPNLSLDSVLEDLSAIGSLRGGGSVGTVDLVYLGQPLPQLMPGDADQDLKFDQLDIVQVATSAKYLTGQSATWGEGDWNGAPGGSPGNPPVGDSLFNQLDIIAALNGNTYLSGPYAAIQPAGEQGDSQTSLVYDTVTGNLSIDAPAEFELTSINIQSASAIFTDSAAENLAGAFDNDADDNRSSCRLLTTRFEQISTVRNSSAEFGSGIGIISTLLWLAST